jgi:hypothetical protein
MESKSTVVTLTLTDLRSTVQIGMAEGTVSHDDVSGSLGGWGGVFRAGISSFKRTPEAQATAAAFFDAYNNLIPALKNYKPQNVKGGLGTGGRLKVK